MIALTVRTLVASLLTLPFVCPLAAAAPRTTVLPQLAEGAYGAFLGFYNGQRRRTTAAGSVAIVEQAAEFAQALGMREVPLLKAKVVGMMGLKGTPGLRLSDDKGGGKGGSAGGGRGGGRGSGGWESGQGTGGSAPPRQNYFRR